MRFVRLARTYEEQNLIINQQNDGIIFLTTRNIMPNEELKAGPSLEYGKRRNLPVLEVKYRNNLGKILFYKEYKTNKIDKKDLIILADSNVEFCTQSHIKTGPLEIADEKVTKSSNVNNLRNNSTKLQKKRKSTRSSYQYVIPHNFNT